ncbi:MAG: tail fiber domain-containing protein [Butyrivibrio sp.]|nr:tail fiber domain-containing protein [Butyrivibrio sp.]
MDFPKIWKVLFQGNGATRILNSEILPSATKDTKGAVKLSDTLSNSGTTGGIAVTPKAVKDSVDGSAVKYSVSQALTDAQKEQARRNIDVPQSDSVVTLSTKQTISGVKTFSASPLVPDLDVDDNSTKVASTKFVQDVINAKALKLDDPQNLTDTQKATLREAIGAVKDDEVVHIEGNEEIKGIKTFKVSPYAPTPETENSSTRVATTAFVKANAYVHPTNAGNKHIPSGGSSGQFLRWSADGTAQWETYTPSDLDTKNTAGSTNNTAKLFLIGATSQDANPQTYSHSSVYETNGNMFATSFQATSDIRKKENIISINNANLSSLNTYSYNFIGSKDRKIGLIAQEVEKLYPEAVTTDEEGFKSLDYNAIVALLVVKVNELEKKYGK